MQGISSALSSLASSPATKGALDLAQVGSTGYNLYNQYQQQQYQNKLRDLSTNPAAVGKLAAGYTQPLNAGLTTGVANQAQAYLASRGLSDSPQISQQVEAQAIAPYIQQNQQQGYQDALQALNLGGGAIPPALQQQTGLDALTQAFSKLGGAGSSTAPTIQDYLRTFGTQPAQIDQSQWNTGTAPGPIDTSSWGSNPLDLSAFYTPDYSTSTGG